MRQNSINSQKHDNSEWESLSHVILITNMAHSSTEFVSAWNYELELVMDDADCEKFYIYLSNLTPKNKTWIRS